MSAESEAGEASEQQTGKAGEVKIDFSSFVMSLATQALMQLGQMKSPEGLDIPVDHRAAKQTIDILMMLKEKTEGNLDSQEDKLLEEILHNLRMSFVQKS